MILSGWIAYAVIYFAFSVADSPTMLIVVFVAYGIYFGLTEPSERAWVADLVPEGLRPPSVITTESSVSEPCLAAFFSVSSGSTSEWLPPF